MRLSRDHHPGLIAAQICKKGSPAYVGLPSIPGEKLNYIKSFWEDDLYKHFRIEEEILIPAITGTNAGLDKITARVLKEHSTLELLFRELDSPPDVEQALDNFGNALDEHIRHEERIWFEMIQKIFDEEFLAALGQKINSADSRSKY